MLEGLRSPEPDLGPDSKSGGPGAYSDVPIRRKGKRRQELPRSSDGQFHGVFTYPHG